MNIINLHARVKCSENFKTLLFQFKKNIVAEYWRDSQDQVRDNSIF